MASEVQMSKLNTTGMELNIWEYAKQKMDIENKTHDVTRTFVVLGDKGVGKTSVLENFGTKSQSSKEMTLGLQYSYSQQMYFNRTITSKFYEVNGGIKSSSQIRFPFDKKNIFTSCIILVVDMSDPEDMFKSLVRWQNTIEKEMKTVYEHLSNQINPNELDQKMNKHRDKLGQHPDLIEFRFCGVPLVIFGNKFDKYTELEPNIKRKISIMLRSYAHCFGANLFCSSSAHHHPQCAKKIRDLIQVNNFINDLELHL